MIPMCNMSIGWKIIIRTTTAFFLAAILSNTCAQSTNSSTPVSQLAALLATDSRDDAALAEIAARADELIKAADAREKEVKAEHKILRQTVGLSNLPPAALQAYFQGSADDLTKRDWRGLAAISEFSRVAREAASPKARETAAANLEEVMAALRNNYRSPLPEKIGFLYALKFFTPEWQRHAGGGADVAANLAGTTNILDVSWRDPQPSTFWSPPPKISAQNLYTGFGRDHLLALEKNICSYDGPKTSYGTTPGLEVKCDGVRYKVKFAEFNSEPFAARVFYALGFHVDETDFAPEIKIHYDRRIFREFNLHKSLIVHMGGPFGISVGTLQLQPYHDPFRNVVAAVFKDGRRISGKELKPTLLVDSEQEHPEADPKNFRVGIESQLDYLVMSAANVQPKDTPAESIGPWDYDGLGHENLREVRAAGLLAAWIGFCDTRWENTRLRVTGQGGHLELLHFFSDLGFGLGGADGFFSLHGEKPNDFAWTFTKPEIVRGRGRMTTPFRVEHYRTIVPARAFQEMTVDDARWMARLIGQLTEEQIRAALIASGYDAAEVKLYEEKLVSRRDRMVCDLRLTNEIPLLRPQGVNRKFNFDPTGEVGVYVTLPNGDRVPARNSDFIIRGGSLRRHP